MENKVSQLSVIKLASYENFKKFDWFVITGRRVNL